MCLVCWVFLDLFSFLNVFVVLFCLCYLRPVVLYTKRVYSGNLSVFSGNITGCLDM